MMITFNELVFYFKEIGLVEGDVLLVHSSYKSLGDIVGGPQTIIDALCSILLPKGTLIVPNFNFDFCSGQPFDIMKTPSQMGIISEMVRKNRESKRNLHPVYSFSFLGNLTEKLSKLTYESSYGKESIFYKLRELNAKIMTIGLPYNNSMTFFHHIEEMEGCDYRFFKEFNGKITNEKNETYDGKITIFVRDLEKGVETSVDRMEEILKNEGIIKIKKIGNSRIQIAAANDIYDRTAKEMKIDPHVLIKIKKTN